MAAGSEVTWMKIDKKLFMWSSFTAIAFNLLMIRGCDTPTSSYIVTIMTFLIFYIPFLPEEWLNKFLEVEY